jgi:putative integral membrane protein (TIGR02587 family)
MNRVEPGPGPWGRELDDFARAFSGAFVFGVPLLFTMEMWWIGTYTGTWRLLLFLAVALAANLVLSYYTGFKRKTTRLGTVNEAVDAVAVGLVASAIVLAVLQRIAIGDPLESVLGKVVVQALPLSIGASVANAVFSRGAAGRTGEVEQQQAGSWAPSLNDLSATAAGAVFIGFSIAPTDEIPMLAAQMDYLHELALIALSLAITYVIVFESGFSPQAPPPEGRGLFQHPVAETVMAYVVSLVVALAALLLFQQVGLDDPLDVVASRILVLGLPAAIGGAAGRLVI